MGGLCDFPVLARNRFNRAKARSVETWACQRNATSSSLHIHQWWYWVGQCSEKVSTRIRVGICIFNSWPPTHLEGERGGWCRRWVMGFVILELLSTNSERFPQDMEICNRGRLFVGNGFSTFSSTMYVCFLDEAGFARHNLTNCSFSCRVSLRLARGLLPRHIRFW